MRNAWCLVLPLLLGCSGKNVVAGEDKTKSEQLAESLPSWCQKICKTFATCAGPDSCECAELPCDCVRANEADCREECREELGRYTSGGDTCAQVGLRYQRCLDELTCAALVDSKAEDCEPTVEEQGKCPGEHDPPENTGPSGGTTATGVGGAATIGGTGVGGATGGTGSDGGTPTDPISCQGAYGVGGSSSGSAAGIICEEGRVQCSDGHDYGWMCARGNNLDLACSCFVDGAPTRGFDPASESCPSLQRVNEACGFVLPN